MTLNDLEWLSEIFNAVKHRAVSLQQLSSLFSSIGYFSVIKRQCWSALVPAEGNGDLQTLICVLVARPRRCLTLSNPVPWQNLMAAYLGYTLRMKTLFRGWPVMAHDTHTRRRSELMNYMPRSLLKQDVKVIWQKAPHGGPIPRLGVTPVGRKLYHWIPGIGFPISVP